MRPDLVVIHYTAMSSTADAARVLCDPGAEVSAHYLISTTGEVVSLVPEGLRAWHAGVGQWGAVRDVNSRSIGIELTNSGSTPFAAPQMDALEALLRGIVTRWDIPAERVIGHSDMAPGRKIDPGPRFDWRRLAAQGLSVWPDAGVGSSGAALQADDLTKRFSASMTRFGYTAKMTHDLARQTFRRRFRPWQRGPLDGVDVAMITDLAHRFPVDAPGRWA